MAIRFRRVSRLCDPTNKELGKKVYPVISYQYDTSATLTEIAKEISSNSGVSEGETISVLKDFRTLLRKTLLAGRSVNIEGLGYFFLSAQSKGTEKAEDFTSADIQGLRICFRANSDIRLSTGTSTRSDGLKFKDLDHINKSDEIRMTGMMEKTRIRVVDRVTMMKHRTRQYNVKSKVAHYNRVIIRMGLRPHSFL